MELLNDCIIFKQSTQAPAAGPAVESSPGQLMELLNDCIIFKIGAGVGICIHSRKGRPQSTLLTLLFPALSGNGCAII